VAEQKELVNRRLVAFTIVCAAAWLIVVAVLGFLTSLKFLWPDFMGGTYFTSFGQFRVTHVNGVIFGWWVTSAIAITFYIVPKLAGRKLYAEPLAWVVAVGWNLGLLVGMASLILGFNQGIELGELVWPLDAAVAVILFLLCVVILGTVIKREEPKIYVSLWYSMAAVVWTLLNWLTGNFGIGFLAYGANSADLHGFYLHNLVGLTITPLGVAMAYYFLPVRADKPLYSHKLSLVGFWTIAFIYPFSGAHHYIFSPIENWVQTVAIAFSLMLIIPVATVVFNLFATMNGRWERLIGDASLKYLMVGTFWYMVVCTQGPLQALRSVQEATHFSDWVIAHSHMAILGTFTFWSFAAIYHVWPKVTGREIDLALANKQFWVTLAGALLMIISLTMGGLLQTALLRNPGVPFVETVSRMVPYWGARSVSGVMLIISFLMFVYILAASRKTEEVADG